MNHRPVTEKRRSNNGGMDGGGRGERRRNFDIVGLLTPPFHADPPWGALRYVTALGFLAR